MIEMMIELLICFFYSAFIRFNIEEKSAKLFQNSSNNLFQIVFLFFFKEKMII